MYHHQICTTIETIMSNVFDHLTKNVFELEDSDITTIQSVGKLNNIKSIDLETAYKEIVINFKTYSALYDCM